MSVQHRLSNRQPQPAVLPHLRRFETPDLAQSGRYPREASGTGLDTAADCGFHLAHRERRSKRNCLVKTLINNNKNIKESHLPQQDRRIQPRPGQSSSAATTPTDHRLPPQNRPLQIEQPSEKDWRKDLSSILLWRNGPNTRTCPAILFNLPPSEAADIAHLRAPQNQALWVCRESVPDIPVCGTHRREDLVAATITSNAEEKENSLSSHSVQASRS